MGLTPDTKIGKIEFCEAHVADWTANSVAMGSSVVEVGAWSAQVTDARAALAASEAADLAARNALNELNTIIDSMMDKTAAIIGQVRSRSKLIGNTAWTLASLPVPATPTPAGAPGIPYGFKVKLSNIGAIEFKWKNTDGRGSVYAIYRALDGSGVFTNLGGTNLKRFTDSTVPEGTSSIVYRVQAIRSTGTSDWGILNVAFGGGASGMFVTEGKPLKAAA